MVKGCGDDVASSVELENVRRELLAIRKDLVHVASKSQSRLEKIHPNFQDGARNLLHYLAFRRRDLRPLQKRLAALGLSSLGRAESNVLATVDAVLRVIGRLTDSSEMPSPAERPVDFARGENLLKEHTERLLGVTPSCRNVRIMVTMPGEAAIDYQLVSDLLQQGMDCMRINCAHDNPAAWLRMIEHLKRAEQSLGKTCRIAMDLAGPKLRTGPLEPGPAVIRIRPSRDLFGRVTAVARVWFSAEDSPQPPPSQATACIPVPRQWLASLG